MPRAPPPVISASTQPTLANNKLHTTNSTHQHNNTTTTQPNTINVQQLLFNLNLEVSSPIFDTATVAQELEQLARRKGNSFGSYYCGALVVDGPLPTSAVCLR